MTQPPVDQQERRHEIRLAEATVSTSNCHQSRVNLQLVMSRRIGSGTLRKSSECDGCAGIKLTRNT
ncbi:MULTISPECIES: hypothetical protein [Burkholderiales]|uniref:hypothetical protein n=1 Tax=Burkholderiales TaxID=80840 RepID=UPI001915FB90|nr:MULTISPECIES: hypothetical protein [Burkholderiales]MBU9208989.1 hypothetical protein [Burkholderia multivorans]